MSNEAKTVIESVPKVIGTSLDMLTKAFVTLMDGLTEREFAKALTDHVIDNKNLDFNVWDDRLYESLDKKLNEQGIPHVMIQCSESGLLYFVTRDSDAEAVRDAKNTVLEEEKRISRVSTQELYRMNAGKNVSSFSNLSETQMKIFQEEAKRNNFVMAAQKQPDGSFKVFFSEKNAEKATQALNNVVAKSTGIFGKLQEQQKTTQINNIKNINEQLKNPSSEFYIVSGVNMNEFVHVDKQGFQHMRGNNLVHFEQRDTGDFVNDVHYQAMGLINPVVFSQEEFEQFKELVDKVSKDTGVNTLQTSTRILSTINTTYNGNVQDFFEAQNRGDITYSSTEKGEKSRLIVSDKNFTPDLTREEFNRLKIENEIRTLISAKMSLDNGNQPENLSSFYNGEVSFSEFFAHEVVNDEHDAEEIAKYEKLIETAEKLDSLPEKDKEYLREFTKEIYQERESHHYSSEYVDRERLARDDLDEFINSHESDNFTSPSDPSFDNIEK